MIAVALDGPSGAGKSTLARKAAEILGYVYVDTGACYRTVAYYALQKGISPSDRDALVPALDQITIELKHNEQGEQRVWLNGEDVSSEIRSPKVSEGSSMVSAIPEVRAWLLDLQRDMAKKNNVIMDGRDIGTVVLPDAQVKIYLTASPEERARRRYEEYLAKGEKIEYNKVLEELCARDERDFTRKIAPLKQSDDAILVDSTSLNSEETLAQILKIIKDRNEKHVL